MEEVEQLGNTRKVDFGQGVSLDTRFLSISLSRLPYGRGESE